MTLNCTNASNSLTNNFEYEPTANGNAKTLFCFRVKNRDLQIKFKNCDIDNKCLCAFSQHVDK